MFSKIFGLAAVTLTAGALWAPAARADDDDPIAQQVCTGFGLGMSPDQIADGLRRNDARLSSPQLPYRVFRDLQNCP